MSDDEDDYKYKKKTKKIESEEDEEEENDEIEEDSNNNQNIIKEGNNTNKKILDNNENNKNSVNEEEENWNSEEQSDMQSNLNNNKIIANEIKTNVNISNNTTKNNIKTAAEYIAQIEELENEIKLERNINYKLKDTFDPEEIQKLKNDLNEKNIMLEKLIITNKKQKSALISLTRQLTKENKKRLKLKSPETHGTNNNGNNFDSEESSTKNSKSDPINIVLKVKDKELFNATNKMNILKSENEGLKKILYENEDYNNKINMEDKVKEINDKIEKSTNEKNILIKQLKLHKKCIEEQQKYNDEYDNLKEELKQIKKNIQNVRNETLKLINDNQKKTINISSFNNYKNNLYKGFLSSNNNNTNKNCNNSSPNIFLNKNKRKINNKKGILLPLISSQITNQNESILTNSFKKKIKEYLDNDEDEYVTLINKINNIENSRKLIENKHRNELKQFNSQIISLDEEFKLLNCNSKGSNCNIRVLKYKLNTIKGDNKIQSKKLNELKKELKAKTNISKDKDYEISLLIGQINSLRNLANYGNIEIPQDEISNYINKIKQEKDNEISENENEEEKDNKNTDNDNKNRNKMEESIQADFSDNEYDNEEEEFEEDEEIIKNNNKYKGKNK